MKEQKKYFFTPKRASLKSGILFSMSSLQLYNPFNPTRQIRTVVNYEDSHVGHFADFELVQIQRRKSPD